MKSVPLKQDLVEAFSGVSSLLRDISHCARGQRTEVAPGLNIVDLTDGGRYFKTLIGANPIIGVQRSFTRRRSAHLTSPRALAMAIYRPWMHHVTI